MAFRACSLFVMEDRVLGLILVLEALLSLFWRSYPPLFHLVLDLSNICGSELEITLDSIDVNRL